jgi:hypothetical protein
MDYSQAHPNAGSQAVATALELPRSRLRPWLDGAKPDPVHAVDTADTNDWLDTQPDDPTFESLAVLTAWLFAGGSLGSDNYTPLFAIGDEDPQEVAERALDTVGATGYFERTDVSTRATELRVTHPPSHLGRFLSAVMQAPRGNKNAQTSLSLPEWLTTVEDTTQLRWARTYVCLRGTPIDPQHGFDCQIREERPQPYLEALGSFFQSVAPPETVSIGKKNVRLRPAATRKLGVAPTLPSSP